MSAQRDPVLVAIARLETKINALSKQVTVHEKQLKWITSLAILIVGAIGGPDAVQLVAGA